MVVSMPLSQVDVPAGADCDDVAAANGLTTAGLLAHNPYINPAQCGSLPASKLCTAQPASEVTFLHPQYHSSPHNIC